MGNGESQDSDEKKIQLLKDELDHKCHTTDCGKSARYKEIWKQKIPYPSYMCHTVTDEMLERNEGGCGSCISKHEKWKSDNKKLAYGYCCKEHFQRVGVKIQTREEVEDHQWYLAQVITFDKFEDELKELEKPGVQIEEVI